MVVGSALSLVDVDDSVQVGEVAIQVDSLGVTAAHKPVLNLPRLGREQELIVRRSEKLIEANEVMHCVQVAVQSPERRPSRSRLGSWRA